MSLVPSSYEPSPYAPSHYDIHYPRPHRIVDQHFGHGLSMDDLLAPFHLPHELRALLRHGGYYRPWRSEVAEKDVGSTVTMDKDKFRVNLDVQQFAPEEITVKITGENVITIEGKHEEKEDEHGYISRHFVRRYVLPKGHNMDKVDTKLSSDGVLTITAPKLAIEQSEHREVPITQTGRPSKHITRQEEVTEK